MSDGLHQVSMPPPRHLVWWATPLSVRSSTEYVVVDGDSQVQVARRPLPSPRLRRRRLRDAGGTLT